MVIPYALRCAAERRPADFSAGTQFRDFVHVDDVAEGIAQVALRVTGEGKAFSVCNLGGGKPVQVREVLDRIARQTNSRELFHLGARPMRDGEPKEQFASVAAAQTILGWQARISWEAGICEDQTRAIIGCAMEVLNILGHGLLEKAYENALCVELGLQNIPYRQQPRYDVLYKNKQVGEYIPDLIVEDGVVVETKTVDRITDHEMGQILNYLKITGLPVGLILNFKYAKLQWKRVVL